MQQKKLTYNIALATVLSQRNRVLRTMTHPWKMLYPKLIKKPKEVKARTFWGGEMHVILPEAVSTHIWRYGYFERDVCEYMLRFLEKGMTFIDIGSHFGFFSLFGSHLVGKEGHVLSLEPIPNTYTMLQKNITSHGKYHNIETHNCAAYSIDTDLKLSDYGLVHSAFNSAFGYRGTGAYAIDKIEVTAEARRIDDFLKRKEIKSVHLIKIDAESSEMHILKGMIKTLEIFKPSIIIEVGDFGVDNTSPSKELVTFLRGMDYSPYEFIDGEIVKHEVKDCYNYGNLLFLPELYNIRLNA